jgi:hypothetical protein
VREVDPHSAVLERAVCHGAARYGTEQTTLLRRIAAQRGCSSPSSGIECRTSSLASPHGRFQTVYDELLRTDSGWSRLFSGRGDVLEAWGRSIVDRLAIMVAGDEIEFVTSSMETVGFDRRARATIFTSRRLVELAPSSLEGNRFEPPEVFTFARSELTDAKLVEHEGDLAGPWRLAVELRYERRAEPLLLENIAEQRDSSVPLLGFLPSLLDDVAR